MKQFDYLKASPYFIENVDYGNHVFYYYRNSKEFHAKIIVPKNEDHELGWSFYAGKKGYFYLTQKVPGWFLELVAKTEEKVRMRDRMPKLFKSKSKEVK